MAEYINPFSTVVGLDGDWGGNKYNMDYPLPLISNRDTYSRFEPSTSAGAYPTVEGLVDSPNNTYYRVSLDLDRQGVEVTSYPVGLSPVSLYTRLVNILPRNILIIPSATGIVLVGGDYGEYVGIFFDFTKGLITFNIPFVGTGNTINEPSTDVNTGVTTQISRTIAWEFGVGRAKFGAAQTISDAGGLYHLATNSVNDILMPRPLPNSLTGDYESIIDIVALVGIVGTVNFKRVSLLQRVSFNGTTITASMTEVGSNPIPSNDPVLGVTDITLLPDISGGSAVGVDLGWDGVSGSSLTVVGLSSPLYSSNLEPLYERYATLPLAEYNITWLHIGETDPSTGNVVFHPPVAITEYKPRYPSDPYNAIYPYNGTLYLFDYSSITGADYWRLLGQAPLAYPDMLSPL